MCSLALTVEKYCSTAITLPLTGYMDRALVECSGNLSISAGPSDKNQSHVHIISGRVIHNILLLLCTLLLNLYYRIFSKNSAPLIIRHPLPND